MRGRTSIGGSVNATSIKWQVSPEPEAARLPRRNFLRLIGGTAATELITLAEGAENYPARPVTLVVPYAAGGASDATARILAQRMRSSLGQPLIIENLTGAAGVIAAGKVAQASPDGYTILLGTWTTHVANPVLYTLSYDVVRDFEPIALVTNTPLMIVARKGIPAPDLKALVAWLRGSKDKVTVATNGIGSGEHIAGLLFQDMLDARFVFVPYRGANLAMRDMVGGQVDLIIGPASLAMPDVRAGNLRAYAVTAKTRLLSAPEVPTVDEAGLPRFHISLWSALFAPRGTPKAAIQRMNIALVEALGDPAVRERLDLNTLVVSRDQQTPEAVRAAQKADIEKWWPIIKAANTGER